MKLWPKEKKRANTILALIAVVVWIGVLISYKSKQPNQPLEPTKTQINPGDVFLAGSYIDFENVEILYDGQAFQITNNRNDIVMIAAWVIGIKNDGSYEYLEMPAFYGIDETTYKEDLDENGWAVRHATNTIRPGETLTAEMHIMGPIKDYPAPDIDGDGYYDIIFVLHPQEDDGHIQVSTADLESPPYKLIAA